jgi:hypothetical protein
MKELILRIERSPYTARTTSGKMFFVYDEKKDYFGFTLEDTARPHNIKVYGETCIPECKCKVSLFENEHYGKTVIFHTEDDGRTIKVGELTWTGCLAHGGNDAKDTFGCVLVAKNRIDNDHIQGSLKDKLREFVEGKMKEGYTVSAEFVNLTQLS